MQRIVDFLIALAKRTPYSHLYHADGSCYMRRYWLMPCWLLQRRGGKDGSNCWKPKPWVPFSLRLHEIITPDYDPHMHDHPWTFLSMVLRGGYTEQRPASTEPCFTGSRELSFLAYRTPGSIALRRCTDRHLISYVEPDTWTLVALGPKRHWWGFYTLKGKVYYRDYPSVHNLVARTEAP